MDLDISLRHYIVVGLIGVRSASLQFAEYWYCIHLFLSELIKKGLLLGFYIDMKEERI